jgi:predicted phage terminase large subunit-like protein
MYRQVFQDHLPTSEAERQTKRQEALRQAQQYRRDYPLHQFVEEAWGLIEPQAFVDGWHLEAICAHLEAVTETAAATDDVPSELPTIRNLLINIPPRMSKSLICSVLWPAWVWLSWPACRWLCSSYSKDLALRDATYSRNIMQSAWYDALKLAPWTFTTDQRVKSFFSNSANGYRITTSVGGMATGTGSDLRLGDDLHNVDEDYSVSRAEITAAKQFWTQTMATRVTNAKRACQVLVGQRVALDDVSNAVLEQGGYDYLKIPMAYEPSKEAPPTALGWTDPRTQEGDLLCPQRFSETELAPLKASLGHRYFTQFQQDPRSELSSIFPRTKWQYFLQWPDVNEFSTIIQSWDARFGDDKESGSFVAGQLWGRKGPPTTGQVYLLDRVFVRMGFVETCKAVVAMSKKWPGAYTKLIEQAANGAAIYDTLRSQVFGLVLVPVGGKYSSKLARAEAEAFVLDQERAWLPHETLAPWVGQYVMNMERFPSEPDDDTDATSQAWNYLVPPPPAKDTVREELATRQDLERQIHLAMLRKGRRGPTSGTRA